MYTSINENNVALAMKAVSSGYETQFHIHTQHIVTWGGGERGGGRRGEEMEGGKSMMMMMMMKYQMFILS